jgi:hypothetical protein
LVFVLDGVEKGKRSWRGRLSGWFIRSLVHSCGIQIV